MYWFTASNAFLGSKKTAHDTSFLTLSKHFALLIKFEPSSDVVVHRMYWKGGSCACIGFGRRIWQDMADCKETRIWNNKVIQKPPSAVVGLKKHHKLFCSSFRATLSSYTFFSTRMVQTRSLYMFLSEGNKFLNKTVQAPDVWCNLIVSGYATFCQIYKCSANALFFHCLLNLLIVKWNGVLGTGLACEQSFGDLGTWTKMQIFIFSINCTTRCICVWYF